MEIELAGLLSPKQAAKLLGISRMTIFRWIKKGKLTPIVVGGQRMLSTSQLEGLRNQKNNQATGGKPAA